MKISAKRITGTLAAAAALTLMAASADAAQYTLNLTSGGTNSGSGFGNVRTFQIGGVTVTATAWGLTGTNSTFENGQLGQWSTGLGICNRSEGLNCPSPQHQVDNVGADDFVLFQFSHPIDPLIVRIDPVSNNPAFDRDVSYWVGTTANPLNLTGGNLAGLGALGFGARIDDDGSASSDARNVSITSGLVNALLFGANAVTDQDDWFKITSIKFDHSPPTQVPEPAGIALLGAALMGLGFARRRRAA